MGFGASVIKREWALNIEEVASFLRGDVKLVGARSSLFEKIISHHNLFEYLIRVSSIS